jgi:hypothetical protein
MRKLIRFSSVLLSVLVVLMVAYFYTQKKSDSVATVQTESEKQSQPVEVSKETSARIESADVTTASVAPTGTTEEGDAQSQMVVAKLQNWVLAESKNLNQPHVDTKQKDLELKKTIENLSDLEKKVILQISLDTRKTANERILAAYMLVLDQSQQSPDNLTELANKSLPEFGPVTAHSESEIRRGQELAVRYMAVDELFKRAPSNREAFDAVKKIAQTADSAEVRSYAQRKLDEIR